jgi:hypothetical protein
LDSVNVRTQFLTLQANSRLRKTEFTEESGDKSPHSKVTPPRSRFGLRVLPPQMLAGDALFR